MVEKDRIQLHASVVSIPPACSSIWPPTLLPLHQETPPFLPLPALFLPPPVLTTFHLEPADEVFFADQSVRLATRSSTGSFAALSGGSDILLAPSSWTCVPLAVGGIELGS